MGESRRDATTSRDAAQPARDSGFEGCADTRVDAEQKPAGVNLVWVIDTSVSMDGEAEQVQKNMNRFAEKIVAAGLEDYRVVVVSERSFVNVPRPLGTDTKHFRHIEQRVDSQAPLEQLIERFRDYEKFLIPDALTHFVAVTDDDSSLSAEEFLATMADRLGTDDFRVHAIGSPPGDGTIDVFGFPLGGCTGPYGSAAGQAEAYWQAAMATGGLTLSICAGDWTMLFDQLAEAVSHSAAVPCSLELPPSPQGRALDYNRVNVVLGGGDPLPRVANERACGTKVGWHYDDAEEPTGIVLCPASCEAAENGGSLQVALGCVTFVQ